MKKFFSQKYILWSLLCIYAIVTIAFYFLGGQQLHVRDVRTDDMVTPTSDVNEIVSGIVISQPFTIEADHITSVSLLTSTYGRENTCSLRVAICRGTEELAVAKLPATQIANVDETLFTFSKPLVVVPRETLTLTITSPDGAGANAVTVYFGSSISVSKGSVEKELDESELAMFNGNPIEGILCFQVNGTEDLLFGSIYWYLVVLGAILLIVCVLNIQRKYKKGISSPILRFIDALRRYGFLMEQLVARDFKTKYKRSVLGILWSFLNPLMMMMVQYVVFSTLFQSNIPNFPLYLLIGIVCFNFFNESTNMCLQSISGNAGLITKVYVPKYIYPVTRVLSSSINLLLSLIPLLLVMFITHTALRPQAILIVFGILCLEIFCLGMGLILASLMVFFRDTQFIWGVLVTILNFATPIFYPESIIPERFMTLYKMNPLYHVIRFIRIVLIDGVSPEPKAYFLCLIVVLVPLVVGILVFKKSQDKFILYI